MIPFKRTVPSGAVLVALAFAATAGTASAADEVVVHAVRAPVAVEVEVDKAEFRADIERYIRAVNGDIRATLADALKPAVPMPEIRLADDGLPRPRG